MNYEMICVNENNGIFTIALNRPEKRNAFNDQLIAELVDALKTADSDSVRVIVLTGHGKHFSAGADLEWMRRMINLSYEENLEDAHQLANMLRLLNEHPKPVIAGVKGSAFGGAIGLIACSDIALATPETQFALSEIKLGLIPATISPFVIDAIGPRQCRKLFLTGEVFNAEKAQDYGLVHEIVDPCAFDEHLQHLASHIAALPPQAVSEVKRLIREVSQPEPRGAIYEYTCQRIAHLRVAPEGQEGLSAFLEKRAPQWPDVQSASDQTQISRAHTAKGNKE
ncbi:MAG: enoyl-CoA hydratase/isomerase family protein [Hahellaceae bacterium]|nr:enoyl-CoA hydratase/isomerase family protein [Hahellaceae bacterium]MCP5170414.1 enoyl-CoA hydratase/isomerase family protein [Hahellaceae bacterium]